MKKGIKEAKKTAPLKFAGTLLKVVGVTVAAGVLLTALTDKTLSKVTGKDKKEDGNE